MGRNEKGDFVIPSKTIRLVAGIFAAIGVLGPSLGVGIAWISRDVSRDADIRQLKEKVAEINGDLEKQLERMNNRLDSIETFLRGSK